ncbi:hypothetical protein NM688_g79 [Phlebia brevispora]|uniref:Uncharacterized protein n=1 Tax=Phlebia brevispora TaxID=194682 RepID=A0ACC1TFG2_9APHY|nr:hypothetical protein NM688_g79 [Phlebia brevispora]
MSYSHTILYSDADAGPYNLLSYEKEWRDRSSTLAQRGYILRPRYDPTWVPSWQNTSEDPEDCEDSIVLSPHYHIMDALQHADQRRVSVKIVAQDSSEVAIASFLSSQQDPANHCVPVLDVISDPVKPNKVLLVMPYLRPFNRPSFSAMGEVLDFIGQTLEGMQFMHSKGVAHRDLSSANIMMDARPLYPQDHHPVQIDYSPDGQSEALHLRRLDHPVRYYFVDFGMSSQFVPGQPHLVLGEKCADHEPPELSAKVPYDPFKVDIFTLGNVYQKEIMNVYAGFDLLQPLIRAMRSPNASLRPDAQQAIEMFKAARRYFNDQACRERVRNKTETLPERIVYDAVDMARGGVRHLMG